MGGGDWDQGSLAAPLTRLRVRMDGYHGTKGLSTSPCLPARPENPPQRDHKAPKKTMMAAAPQCEVCNTASLRQAQQIRALIWDGAGV